MVGSSPPSMEIGSECDISPENISEGTNNRRRVDSPTKANHNETLRAKQKGNTQQFIPEKISGKHMQRQISMGGKISQPLRTTTTHCEPSKTETSRLSAPREIRGK